ncbi:hypothetical protein ACLEPN_43915, partial [Myxococcus sp. 1LA]
MGGSPEAAAWLEAARADVTGRLAALKDEEQAAESLARTAREARAALETQRTRREVAAEALRRAEEALSRAEAVLKDVHARLDATEQTLRQVVAELSPVFTADAGWDKKLEGDPATFRRKCGERVVMWKGKEEARQQAELREVEEQRHRARAQGQVEVVTRHAEEHQGLAVLKEQERGEVAARARRCCKAGPRPRSAPSCKPGWMPRSQSSRRRASARKRRIRPCAWPPPAPRTPCAPGR